MVIMLAIAVGLSYSLSYGLETHATYLLYPLRELDPQFLQFDWLAAQTTAYHKNFAIIFRLLSVLGPLPWGVAIANVALVATFILTIYGFLVANFHRDALVAILLLMFFVVIERTTSFADSHLLTFRFEPSSVAACAVTIGLFLLITERYLWSGIFIAVAGFFHTNFLLLDFVFFGCAHLALGRKGIIRRAIPQFAPSLAVVLHELPMLYAMATDPRADDARYIIQIIRGPHHYAPLTDLSGFVPFAGWHLLACSCIGVRSEDENTSSRLVRIYFAFTGVIILGATLTTLVFVPQVSQLFFPRMAPFSILLAQLIIVTSVASSVEAGGTLTLMRPIPWRLTAGALGGGLLLTHYILFRGPLDIAFVVVSLALAVTTIVAGSGYLRRGEDRGTYCLSLIRMDLVLLGILIAALMFSVVPPKYVGGLGFSETSPFYKRYNVLFGEPVPLRQLYAWARTTDPAAQFLIPPNMKSFRVFAGRAVVVDWQSTPWLPTEVVEWYRRIGRVSGNSDVKNVEDAEAGYARMDELRMRSLAEEFGVDYAVFRKPFDVPQVNTEIVFENGGFIVVKACGDLWEDCRRQK